MARRILVLGGARFHGYLLVRHFLELGDDVTVLNRGHFRREYPAGVRHVKADRTDRGNLQAVIGKAFFDAVIDNSAYGAAHVASLAPLLSGRCGHYLLTSTAAVYLSLASDMPLREEEATGVRTGFFSPAVLDYARDKLAAEAALRDGSWDIPWTVLRLPNVFGEGDPARKLLYFYLRLSGGGSIALESEVKRFSLIHAADVPVAYARLLADHRCFGRILNVADPEPCEYGEFFPAVFGKLFDPSRVFYAPAEVLWRAGIRLPLAWGPVVDVRATEALGSVSCTPLAQWGPRALAWQLDELLRDPVGAAEREGLERDRRAMEGLTRG